MRLVKGKRQYKLPKYRQIVCVAIRTRTSDKTWFDWSLQPVLPSFFATLNPDNVSNPVYYAVGKGGELFVWPTPSRNGRLNVTLAVERKI